MSKLSIILTALIGLFFIGTSNGLNSMKAPEAATPLLVTDAQAEQLLPNKLRIVPNYHGIAGIVGSSQFNQAGLEAIIGKIKAIDPHHQLNKKIWLVDLRQETHFFANRQPLSFYGSHNSANFHKTPAQIHQEESEIISFFQQKTKPTTVNIVLEKANGEIAKTRPESMNLQTSQAEETVARSLKLRYKRFYITDHQAPTPENTKKLVEFINQLGPNDWIIVHCRGGKGRTTTFMLLTALLKDKANLKNAELKNIESYIQEQIDLGGSNLFNTDDGNDPLWQQEHKKNRAKFIHHFYQHLP